MTRPTVSLRERKKAQTKFALQRAALGLFLEHGFDATTIDDIVEVVDVSQSTFFRYFPTKEDVVFWDEYDDLILTSFVARLETDPPIDAMWNALRTAVDEFYTRDRSLLLARMQLMHRNPALLSRSASNLREVRRQAAAMVAQRLGIEPHDLGLNLGLAVAFATLMSAVEYWQEVDGAVELTELLDRCRGDVEAWMVA